MYMYEYCVFKNSEFDTYFVYQQHMKMHNDCIKKVIIFSP